MKFGVTQILVNRGSDVDFSFTWTDTAGDAVDLFDWSIDTMDVDSRIDSYLTVSISDPANGIISGRVEWNDSLEAGVGYRFRIQITEDTEDQATNLIEVLYQ